MSNFVPGVLTSLNKSSQRQVLLALVVLFVEIRRRERGPLEREPCPFYESSGTVLSSMMSR